MDKKREKLKITEWAIEDRPREKMMLHGIRALSNAELIAILIGSGNVDETAVELPTYTQFGWKQLEQLG